MPTDNKAYVTAVIGQKHMGKSHYIESKINDPLSGGFLAYDPCREYGDIGIWDKDIHTFADTIYRNRFDLNDKGIYNIILEECTTIVRNTRGGHTLERLLTENRHFNMNFYVVFHEIRALPLWAISQIDTVVLFRTKELPKNVGLKLQNDWPKVREVHSRYFEMTKGMGKEEIVEKMKGVYEVIDV